MAKRRRKRRKNDARWPGYFDTEADVREAVVALSRAGISDRAILHRLGLLFPTRRKPAVPHPINSQKLPSGRTLRRFLAIYAAAEGPAAVAARRARWAKGRRPAPGRS